MKQESTKISKTGLGIVLTLFFCFMGLCMNSIYKSGQKAAPNATDLVESAKVDSTASAVEDSLARVQQAEAQEKAKKLLAKMRKSVDDMEGVTFFYHPTSPKYADQSSFHVYLGQNKEMCWLRFRIQYAADDWLFIENFKIKADSAVFEIMPTVRVTRDNSAGLIWETWDEQVDLDKYAMLKKVAASKVCKLRYIGSQHYDERIITEKEKAALRDMLAVFEGLGCRF